MKKGEVKEAVVDVEEVEVEEIMLVQTVIDEHGTIKSKTYKNMKTGEEIVETL